MSRRRPRDPLVIRLLTGVPWWSAPLAAAGTAALFYAVSRQAAFLAQALWPLGWECSGLIGLVFLGGWWRGRERRRLLLQSGDMDRLRSMPWPDFETLVGECFRQLGYRVRERGGKGADGGVDLELHRDAEVLLVQCKRWRERLVKVQPVRELWGVVNHEGASGGIFVTSGRFTEPAREFARGKRYQLIDGTELARLIARSPAPATAGTRPGLEAGASPAPAGRAPSCPRCGTVMRRRAGRQGRPDFWGCSRYPQCRETISPAG